jgi:TonB family protein
MKQVYILPLLIAFLFSSVISFAQDKKPPALIYPKGPSEKQKSKAVKEQSKPKKVKAGFGVTVVQVEAEFPGGTDSLESFVRRNTNYPKKSQLAGIEGDVYIGFMITKEGKVKDARVLSSINDELDEEALRIVQLMPDWKPGYAGDVPVDVQYILPFSFILPKRL